MKSLRYLLTAATALIAVPSVAQETNPFAERENRVPPIVSYFQGKGIKLTSIGDAGGLLGYLGEDATGKQQVFYVTPDGKHVVAGLMIGMGGNVVTGVQVGEMRARFEAAAKSFETSANEVKSFTSEENKTSTDTNNSAPSPDVEKKTELETGSNTSDVEENKVEAVEPNESSAAVAPSTAPVFLPDASGPVAGEMGSRSELWLSKLNKDEFLAKVNDLPFFEVGSVTAPATLWMVADPQCPYCHKTWEHVKSSVLARKLKVRVILIAGLKGSEEISTDMLARVRPARAWLDSNAGRNLKLEVDKNSEEYKKAGQFLEKNMEFARSMGFEATPFLAYVAADGKFYSSIGVPNDLKAFLAETGI